MFLFKQSSAAAACCCRRLLIYQTESLAMKQEEAAVVAGFEARPLTRPTVALEHHTSVVFVSKASVVTCQTSERVSIRFARQSLLNSLNLPFF
jgi:hypothetical protein